MNFEDAVRKSMKMYWENVRDYDNLGTSKQEGRKYNKKYFDSVEEEFLNAKEKSDKKVKEYK